MSVGAVLSVPETKGERRSVAVAQSISVRSTRAVRRKAGACASSDPLPSNMVDALSRFTRSDLGPPMWPARDDPWYEAAAPVLACASHELSSAGPALPVTRDPTTVVDVPRETSAVTRTAR